MILLGKTVFCVNQVIGPLLTTLTKAIDRISAATGALSRWLLLGMVFLGAFNAIARYFDRYTGFGLSSNTYIELQWYFFAAVFLLAAAETLRSDSHVRVDVVYGRLSSRGKAITNVLGTLIFLVPFCVMMVIVSWPTVSNSWAILEQSPDPGGLPRYPIKTIIPIAFVLLLLQALALLVRQLPVALGRSGSDSDDGQKSVAHNIRNDAGDLASGVDGDGGGNGS